MRAVVLGGHTAGLAVARSLGRMGVPVTVLYHDRFDPGVVSRYVENSVFVPHPEDDEGRFIETLLDLGGRLDRSFLIPSSDVTLAPVSRHKAQLERFFIVACAEWEVAKMFIDKKNTWELADSIGVVAPRTLIPCSVEEVESYARDIEYPCLVKPRQVHKYFPLFKRKMELVGNLDEMIQAYRRAAGVEVEVMLQEYIPGEDSCGVNYNSYFWDGEPLVEFTATKVRNGPPRLGSPSVAMSSVVPEVIEPGRKILKAMGFHGYACSEFKRDPRDGLFKLMEVNGRHNLSSLLAVRSGINFPWLHYRHLVMGEAPTQKAYETGIYWIDITRDVVHGLRHWRKEGYSFRQFAGPYLRPHVFAIWDTKDPMPFLRRLTSLALMAAAAANRKLRERRTIVHNSGAGSATHAISSGSVQTPAPVKPRPRS